MNLVNSLFQWTKKHSQSGWRRHSNPDGSIGGMVSIEATVEDNVYIEISGIVTAGAVVKSGSRILCGDIVQADGSVYRISPYPEDFEYQPVFPT